MSYIKGKISPRPGNKRNGKSRKSGKQGHTGLWSWGQASEYTQAPVPETISCPNMNKKRPASASLKGTPVKVAAFLFPRFPGFPVSFVALFVTI
jgi:hypothetical protein